MTAETELDRINRVTTESEETKDNPIPAGVRPVKPNKSVPVAAQSYGAAREQARETAGQSYGEHIPKAA